MSAPDPSKIKVRFAPSPTGYLHVGGARTALFNWLFARRFGGSLVLRIEDTDVARSTHEMVEGILTGLSWLGIDWDEGPFFQNQRLDLYRSVSDKLLRAGHAYYCFCTKDELEARRELARAEGRQYKYEGTCRSIVPGEALRRKDAGESCAMRFAAPQDGTTSVEDAVFGHVEFANMEIEDFVLLRSDGQPTYHLSVVCDDIDMSITHVIRGADHLSNTPKQVMIYRALAAPMPVFAHVPLILGTDKSRLSKRHGATSVMAYRDEGIVPQAFRNFLALLGWTPKASPGEKAAEIFGDREMIARFSLEDISRSNAVFDRAKLDWFNSEYIRAMPAADLLPLIEREWAAAGIRRDTSDRDALCATIDLLKARARNLNDFAVSFAAFFIEDFAIDPRAREKFLADEKVRGLLRELGQRYAGFAQFDETGAEAALRQLAAENDIKAGALINGARVALTGQAVAPSLFAVMLSLGKERTVRRLLAV